MILGLDTSTSAITAALVSMEPDGFVQVQAAGSVVDARAHTEQLAPLLAELLAEAACTPADLTAIVVGTGPGPFTGLRVGLVTGVTMAHALQIPVYGVCSLDALAASVAALAVRAPSELLVATDARRKEVYWARYALDPAALGADHPSLRPGTAYRRLGEPAVDRPDDVPEEVRVLPTAGRGSLLYPGVFTAPLEVPLDVDARWLLTVAGPRIVAGEPMPVVARYLRRPDALTTAERAAARQGEGPRAKA